METTSPISTFPNALRFSLRSLLIALGVVCLLLAPVQWFGAPYFISASFSVLLIGICTLVCRSSSAGTIAVSAGGVIVGFLIAIGLLVFFLHALANFIACLVLLAFRPRPRVFAITLAGVMVAVYGFSFSQGAAKLSELRELRVRYPFESLSSRLAFEGTSRQGNPVAESDVQLSPAVANSLQNQDASQEQRRYYFSRAEALRELHEDSSAEFVRAAGFGFMRMPSLTYRLVDIEQPETLSLPINIGITQPPTSSNDLDMVHRVAVEDFLSPDRMGYVRSRDAVAGFESHRLNTLRSSWERVIRSVKRWQVVRLELVGLLRNEPRVYVSETLPQLDKIAEAPHRPLNDFESRALPQLASQNNIVVDQQPKRIQMLGALRAGKSCLQCHEGDRGKLLGAFSYEIVPLPDAEKMTASSDESMRQL